MRKKRRETLDIYYEVLSCLSRQPSRLTHIMRRCNLDTRMTRHVISTLVKGGLVYIENHGKYKLYHVTEKGIRFLRAYESLSELLDK